MAISFSNIPSNIRTPLFYAEMDNSMANTATGSNKSLLIGQMLEDGQATANAPVLISSVNKAKELFGRGSQLALMVEAYRNQDTSGELWCVGQKVEGVAATGKIHISGETIKAGILSLYVNATKLGIVIPAQTSDEEIAKLVVASINSKKDLPIRAESQEEMIEASAAKLVGSALSSEDLSPLKIANASCKITIDGTAIEINDLDLSECEDFEAIATALQSKLDNRGTISFVDDHFEIISATTGTSSTVDYVTTASDIGDDTDIATLLKLSVDAKATQVLGKDSYQKGYIVICTAKGEGKYGDEIILNLNLRGYVNGEENLNGVEVTIDNMADGEGVVDLDEVFSHLGDETYTFVGIPDCDADNLDKCKNEFNDSTGRWSYARMQYGHVFTTMRRDDNELVTFGKLRNDQHVSIFGIEKANPEATWVLTAAITGREAQFISIDPARPTQTGQLNNIMATAIESRFNMQVRDTLLHNGIATLYVEGGYVRIERAITTYQVNSMGDEDNSYLDSETLFTLATIVTRLKTVITSKYARHKLANDGTRYGPGQAIVTPNVIRSELIAQYNAMEQEGLVENADLFAKYLIVERNANDPNRLDVLLPPDLVNQLRIFAMLTQFRLQYSNNA